MLKPGVLHKYRFKIVKALQALPVKAGDIFYRHSNAYGPCGLPFSKLVGKLSRSKFTHATVALPEGKEIWMMEVNELGTWKMRLIDWLELVHTRNLRVYRLKNYNTDIEQKFIQEINRILELDPEYDFNFSSDDKLYCTESVAAVYQNVGHPLVEPEYLKDLLPPIAYQIIYWGNKVYYKLTGCSMPFDKPLYYVGNEKKGMMSSPHTELIYEIR